MSVIHHITVDSDINDSEKEAWSNSRIPQHHNAKANKTWANKYLHKHLSAAERLNRIGQKVLTPFL